MGLIQRPGSRRNGGCTGPVSVEHLQGDSRRSSTSVFVRSCRGAIDSADPSNGERPTSFSARDHARRRIRVRLDPADGAADAPTGKCRQVRCPEDFIATPRMPASGATAQEYFAVGPEVQEWSRRVPSVQFLIAAARFADPAPSDAVVPRSTRDHHHHGQAPGAHRSGDGTPLS